MMPANMQQQVYLYCSLLFYFAGEGASVSSTEANRDLINLNQA